MAKYKRCRITEHNYDFVWNMHLNSYHTAVKALVGHMGRKLYSQMTDQRERQLLAGCLDRISEKQDVSHSARCLVKARERHLTRQKFGKDSQPQPSQPTLTLSKAATLKRRLVVKGKTREYVNYLHYMETDRPLKLKILPIRANKTLPVERRRVPRRVHDNHHHGRQQRKPISLTESLQDRGGGKSPVLRVVNLIQRFVTTPFSSPSRRGRTVNGPETEPNERNWHHIYHSLLEIQQGLEAKMNTPGARVHEQRMYDLVVDPSQHPSSNHLAAVGRGREASSPRVLSPRIMPVMPEQTSGGHSGVLSPSIFALYDVPQETNSILPLPRLLNSSGLMSEREQDKIMETLVEASGATDFVDKALRVLKEMNFLEPGWDTDTA